MDSPNELKIRVPQQPDLLSTVIDDDLVLNSLIYNQATAEALKKLVHLMVGKIDDQSNTIKYSHVTDNMKASKCDVLLGVLIMPYARFQEMRLLSTNLPVKIAIDARELYHWVRSFVCRLPIHTTFRQIDACNLKEAVKMYNNLSSCISTGVLSDTFLALADNKLVPTIKLNAEIPSIDVDLDPSTRETLKLVAHELMGYFPTDMDKVIDADSTNETDYMRSLCDEYEGLIADSLCWCADSIDIIDEKHDNYTLFSLNPSYHSRCSFIDYEREAESYSDAINSLITRYVEMVILRNGKGVSPKYETSKITYTMVLRTLVQAGTMLVTIPGTDLTPLSFARVGFYHNVSCLSDMGLVRKLDKLFEGTDFGLTYLLQPEDYLVARLSQNMPHPMIKWVLYCRVIYMRMIKEGIVDQIIKFGQYS